jgi:hypothetical protein
MDTAIIRDTFPFDVLGVIFDYYVDGETIEFPLETMLLVCRSWNEAALGHRNLWARLKIYLGHFPTSDIWEFRLPRRLERAGDSTLLEIDLRSVLDSRNLPQEVHHKCSQSNRLILYPRLLECDCIITARRMANKLLSVLVGPQGELCRRWKSLYLCVGPHNLRGKELTYPTPNLEAVSLELLSAQGISILPSIPKLKTLEIFNPHNMTLPNIDNVRNLVILDSTSRTVDLSNLKTATNLESLTIGTKRMDFRLHFSYTITQFLPHLSSMSFIRHVPSNLNEIQAPNLRRLSLKLCDPMEIQAIIGSSLPLWDLQELELTWPNAYLTLYEGLKSTMSDILLSCINLTHIKGERKSLSIIVKLYWEECATRGIGQGYITGKTLSFWSNDVGREVSVRRPEGKSELEGVALSLGLIPPSMSWEHMIAHL